jgi:hypothetical protein
MCKLAVCLPRQAVQLSLQCWCRRLQTKLVQLSEMEMHC